jgi:hypothetical protein
MATFDERRRGFEEKFRADQEFRFRLNARRNRLFGKWAAGALGLSGSEAEAPICWRPEMTSMFALILTTLFVLCWTFT